MTCFWDGLINNLVQKKYITKRKTPAEFLAFLQRHNSITRGSFVKVNGHQLTENQMIENYEHIKALKPNDLVQGYLCSTCDPVLICVSELFGVNIHHTYMNNQILYQFMLPPRQISSTPLNNNLYFQSDRGHFWMVK